MVTTSPQHPLVLSTRPVSDFPGEGRRILEVLPFASSVLKQIATSLFRMQVCCPKLPMAANFRTSSGLKRVMALHRLMAATVVPDTPVL